MSRPQYGACEPLVSSRPCLTLSSAWDGKPSSSTRTSFCAWVQTSLTRSCVGVLSGGGGPKHLDFSGLNYVHSRTTVQHTSRHPQHSRTQTEGHSYHPYQYELLPSPSLSHPTTNPLKIPRYISSYPEFTIAFLGALNPSPKLHPGYTFSKHDTGIPALRQWYSNASSVWVS